MRLFIGIPLPDQVKGLIDVSVAPLRREYPGLSWVRAENYHITILFLGEVRETLVPELVSSLSEAAVAVPRFRCATEALGSFPHGSRPRVIHLPILAGSSECSRAYAGVHLGMSGLTDAIGTKDFSPHITVARVKRGGDSRLARAVAQCAVVTSFEAASFCLYSSRLTPAGAIYTVLDQFGFSAR